MSNLDGVRETFVTPADLARRYGTTAETVRRWIRAGKLKAIHTPTGGRVLIPWTEVQRFESTSAGTDPPKPKRPRRGAGPDEEEPMPRGGVEGD